MLLLIACMLMARNYQDKLSAQHIELTKICQSKLYNSRLDGEVEEKTFLWEHIYFIIERTILSYCLKDTEVQSILLNLLKICTLKIRAHQSFLHCDEDCLRGIFCVMLLTLFFPVC